MGGVTSTEIPDQGNNNESSFVDKHSGLKPWVRFEYCKRSIQRFNRPRILRGR